MRDDVRKKMETVAICPIAEEHITTFGEFLELIACEPLYLTAIEPPDEDTLRSAVQNHIANLLPLVIATDRESVVGWCAIGPKPKPGFTHTGVLGIGLLSDYRQRGIGSRLLEAALAKAHQRGLTRIELEVFSSNAPAIAFYEKHGFKLEGCKAKARLLEGRYDDVTLMARLLD